MKLIAKKGTAFEQTVRVMCNLIINLKTKVMIELKECQNCTDTMYLIKVIVASSLFSAFLVLAPHEVVIPVVLIAVIAAIIALIIWSFQQERHMYDRDKPYGSSN